MSSRLRSTAFALLLFAWVAAAAHARPLNGRPAPEDLFASFWNRIVSVLVPGIPADPATSQRALGEKEGSSMDPNGSSLNGTTPPVSTSDAGSQMDPNG